jgi:hypothetical protein
MAWCADVEIELNPPKPVVIYDDLPKDEAHGWKFLTIGPDNKRANSFTVKRAQAGGTNEIRASTPCNASN